MKKDIYCENIVLKPAENGFILSYTEVTSPNGKNNSYYSYKEKVYAEGDAMQAVADMKALAAKKSRSVAIGKPEMEEEYED